VDPGDERFKAARYLSLADDSSFPTWNLEAFIGFLEHAYRLRPDRGRPPAPNAGVQRVKDSAMWELSRTERPDATASLMQR